MDLKKGWHDYKVTIIDPPTAPFSLEDVSFKDTTPLMTVEDWIEDIEARDGYMSAEDQDKKQKYEACRTFLRLPKSEQVRVSSGEISLPDELAN